MKHLFLFIFFILSSVCFCQIGNVSENDINYKDLIEIKGLFYLKADSTLATGRVVRFNRKNEPKKYIEVVKGKPQNHEWINFHDDIQNMEYDGLGTLVNAAVGLTGLAMAVTGNDLDIPTGNNANNLSQDDNLIILQQDREKGYNAKMKLEEEKRLISKNLNSNPKSEIMSESKPQIELPENGLYEEFYGDSKLRSTGNYINEKKDGLWEEYHENGQLKSRVNYLDGKKVGQLNTYHSNGRLQSRVNYVDGKEDGEIMVYNEKGEIIILGFFKEGNQSGLWNYYENGKLIRTESFE